MSQHTFLHLNLPLSWCLDCNFLRSCYKSQWSHIRLKVILEKTKNLKSNPQILFLCLQSSPIYISQTNTWIRPVLHFRLCIVLKIAMQGIFFCSEMSYNCIYDVRKYIKRNILRNFIKHLLYIRGNSVQESMKIPMVFPSLPQITTLIIGQSRNWMKQILYFIFI